MPNPLPTFAFGFCGGIPPLILVLSVGSAWLVAVLGVKDVIVCGHTECGGVRAGHSKADHGLVEHWVKGQGEGSADDPQLSSSVLRVVPSANVPSPFRSSMDFSVPSSRAPLGMGIASPCGNVRDVARLHAAELSGIKDDKKLHARMVELNVIEQWPGWWRGSAFGSLLVSFHSGQRVFFLFQFFL